MPRVIIILINFNNEHHTVECLRSLQAVHFTGFEILVVDNGSRPESIRILETECANTEIIKTPYNLGFAGGNNFGIRHALQTNPEYILLLNNDTLVEPDFLDPLVSAMENDSSIGASSGTICYYPDKSRVWYAGGEYVPWRATAIHTLMDRSYAETGMLQQRDVTFVSGCLMLLRKNALERVGLLDERLYMYYEDLEMSQRLVKSGYRLVHVPTSRIYHKITHGGNTPFTVYYGLRSRMFLLDGFSGLWGKMIGRTYILFVLLTKLVRWRLSNVGLYRAAMAAIKDYRRGVTGPGESIILKYPEVVVKFENYRSSN